MAEGKKCAHPSCNLKHGTIADTAVHIARLLELPLKFNATVATRSVPRNRKSGAGLAAAAGVLGV